MSLTRSQLIAIGQAVQDAGGDMRDVDDLVATWQRLERDWEPRVDRVRAQATRPCCSCVDGGQLGTDGRCRRCWGWST